MSVRIFAWDANPAVDPFLFRQSDARGKELVEAGKGKMINLPCGRQAIQLFPPVEVALERVAHNTVLPVARILSKLKRPPRIHYPIPACGAHDRRTRVRDINYEP